MSSPPPTSPRRNRTSRSSAPAEILKATETLLIGGGMNSVSIRRVSDASGYSAPTIYHHFGDKRGLIEALLEARFRVIHETMAAIPRDSDPAAYLRDLASAFVRFALQNPDYFRVLITPLDTEPDVPSVDATRNLVRGALEALAREGTLATLDVEAAFEVLWVVLHGLTSLQLIHPNYKFVDNLTELALDTVEAGLLRRKERMPSA